MGQPAAEVNNLLEDLAGAMAEMSRLHRLGEHVLRSARPLAAKRRMLAALAEAARAQRQRVDDLLETLGTAARPMLTEVPDGADA